ncbi:TPA: YiiX/YebB-like N1pC/P60 family cysteine hydrolase [Escherichia coli]
MLIKNKSEIHLSPHFMLNYELLQPGDIILERGYAWYSEKIAKHTNSRYSHAMIYVGGTIIEATRGGGVYSRVPNRSTVRDISDFKVLRLKEFPGKDILQVICDHARSLCGSQYSVSQALKVKGPDFLRKFANDSRKQFCSRLVAQCYQKAGIQLTENINFCSPGDIERSDYLVEQPEMVYRASEEDVAHAQGESPHTQHTKNAVNFVRNALSIFENYGIKTVGSSDGEVVITTLNDITLAVYENRNKPGLDEEITKAMRLSGYLDHIELDRQKNPYRYDLMLFSQKVEVHGNENKTLEILRHELKKEQDIVEVRLRSYLAGRHNLNSGLKFNELEFTIAHGLLKGMLERVIVIEKYTVTKRNDVRFKMINVACNRVIQNITMKAPELNML